MQTRNIFILDSLTINISNAWSSFWILNFWEKKKNIRLELLLLFKYRRNDQSLLISKKKKKWKKEIPYDIKLLIRSLFICTN